MFEQQDIRNAEAMSALFETYQPDKVLHLAAESHVDRFIDGPRTFIETNVSGTFILLEASCAYFHGLEECSQSAFRFHHVSTDEVYGCLTSTPVSQISARAKREFAHLHSHGEKDETE